MAKAVAEFERHGRLPAAQTAAVLDPVTQQVAAAVAPLTELQAQLAAASPRIDLPPLPRFELPAGFQELLWRYAESRPPNWPSRPDLDRLQEAIQDDGIPLVWVPRADIVTALLNAPDQGSGADGPRRGARARGPDWRGRPRPARLGRPVAPPTPATTRQRLFRGSPPRRGSAAVLG